MESSDSVQNYIKGIYALSGEDKNWVSTNHLAEKMHTRPSSVTDMMKKLDQKNLVIYQKYKGFKLTTFGNQLALDVIRRHRLWEVFLEQKLGFSWDEVHEIAEQMEHISSKELIRRLDKFLDYPQIDPHGDPIPDEHGKMMPGQRLLLYDCKVGGKYEVVGVQNSQASFLQFLKSKALTLGVKIKVLKTHDFDGSMDIQLIEKKHSLNVSKQVSQNLFVIKHD